jgi:2-polyprenyl-6-methoxyphenol hydroxylase-like FAD-dependent oxidoreductase
MDVLWFKLSRRPDDGEESRAQSTRGRLMAVTNRNSHWQVAYVVPKDSAEQVRTGDIAAFRAEIASLLPTLADRVGDITDWDAVKTLRVRVDRLRRWYRPGLLCIGDSAHAMSPVGGIGVNLAVQDAVATANILAERLLDNRVRTRDLARVQRRRALPAKVLQRLQLAIQRVVLNPVLEGQPSKADRKPPAALRLLARAKTTRRMQARLFAYGVRPERVRPLSRQPRRIASR